ncbi:Fumarylacetoacetate (FAA) hydrolase family protein [Stieleria maiorica]|uniref:fumarylacetoacetase n=1 Tax=Stieleria maiorica TaxID=2795974 RepID=A0A5B9MK38_9BACT|nr:fumarylacetoacetase [Stieleria maiorica]QEG01579.1 Fumarylacetoacetate (FAA) hydrolase family protein [Stieleria maiorica]
MISTTDPRLRSFVPAEPESHFPIQNLPYGVFRPPGGTPRVGVAIGDRVLDLSVLASRHLLDVPEAEHVFSQGSLNAFMALGRTAWGQTRRTISHLLRSDVATIRDDIELREQTLLPIEEVELLLPIEIGDYTDFYSSRHHATNVGSMIRGPENALNPNWVHLPVAYHGRASSVVVSGTNVFRPRGQRLTAQGDAPSLGPSRAVDFELEVGFVIGTGNTLGHPVSIDQAEEHVFGVVLVNDWSARDIQKWEYQPLGPFLSKNFATSISPWVVTLEALAPFRSEGPRQDPPPLPYLAGTTNRTFDIHLEAVLRTSRMPKGQRITATNLRHVYWSFSQQVAHHTVNGCNLRTGDLLATGTVSGPSPDSLGCLLEISQGGKQPLALATGETRTFLEDGDQVTLTGWCRGDGYRIGFGEVTGTVLPAREV